MNCYICTSHLFSVADALCGNCCICNPLIFAVADALFLTNVSATCFSLNLQILLSLLNLYNCIYILPFLELEDTSFANFSSASHVFYDLQMLLIKILHLQSPKIRYHRYSRSISFKFYLVHDDPLVKKTPHKSMRCSSNLPELGSNQRPFG